MNERELFKEKCVVDELTAEYIDKLVKTGFDVGDIESLKDEFIDRLDEFDYVNVDEALYRYSLYIDSKKYYVVYSDMDQLSFENWLCDQKFVDALDVGGFAYLRSSVFVGGGHAYGSDEAEDKLISRLVKNTQVRVKVGSVVRIESGDRYVGELFSLFVKIQIRNKMYGLLKPIAESSKLKIWWLGLRLGYLDCEYALMDVLDNSRVIHRLNMWRSLDTGVYFGLFNLYMELDRLGYFDKK